MRSNLNSVAQKELQKASIWALCLEAGLLKALSWQEFTGHWRIHLAKSYSSDFDS